MKEKVEKFDFIKTENICFVKDPRKRMKKTRYGLGENTCKSKRKDFYIKHIKNFQNSTGKQQSKNVSLKKIHRCQISI